MCQNYVAIKSAQQINSESGSSLEATLIFTVGKIYTFSQTELDLGREWKHLKQAKENHHRDTYNGTVSKKMIFLRLLFLFRIYNIVIIVARYTGNLLAFLFHTLQMQYLFWREIL